MNTAITNLPLAEVHHPLREKATSPTTHAACESASLPTDRSRNGDFWSKVLRTECCWLWTRARSTTGYGVFWRNGKLYKAHRVAYELAEGPIPGGLDVMHDCDVKHCVRPDHIRPATRAENQQDMARKGRSGSDGRRHLTPEQVLAIRRMRAEGWTQQALADRFGVTWSCISNIDRRVTWRHLTERTAEAAA